MAAQAFIPDIAVIGAGFSGISLAYYLAKELGSRNYQYKVTIYEKASKAGGTWRDNKYPGCGCDVVSHLYSFSFNLNPNWSKSFAETDEIEQYVDDTIKKFKMEHLFQFNHQLVHAEWQEKVKHWTLRFKLSDGSEITKNHHFLVSGGGGLLNPHFPSDIPGWEKFKGNALHSARWDRSIQVEDKVLAVVGTGASAVQIIQALAPKVKKLIVYQRTPGWIVPKDQYKFSGFFKWLLRTFPILLKLFRLYLFIWHDIRFSFLIQNSWFQMYVKRWLLGELKKHVKDDALRAKLTPNFSVGCKRILPATHFLQVIQDPKTELVTDKIDHVSENGIVTVDGVERKADVIVAATGFESAFHKEDLKILGRKGLEPFEAWKLESGSEQSPVHLNGLATSHFPNHFMLLGPNTGIGHISAIYMAECQCVYISKLIGNMIEKNVVAVDVKESVQRKYTNAVWAKLRKTVWVMGGCKSWYNPEGKTDGRIGSMYPGPGTSFWLDTLRVSLSDFIVDTFDGKTGLDGERFVKKSLWTRKAVVAVMLILLALRMLKNA